MTIVIVGILMLVTNNKIKLHDRNSNGNTAVLSTINNTQPIIKCSQYNTLRFVLRLRKFVLLA